MTNRRNFKRLVRARAARTGESYTAALRHFLPEQEATVSRTPSLALAVGTLPVHGDPGDVPALREAGRRIRDLMRRAHTAGARLLHLPEGATCFPHKLVMSQTSELGPSDWSKAAWPVLDEELTQIRSLAAELGSWVVLGSIHRAEPRAHNSLYVVDARGRDAVRYDERFLSHTKRTHMYTAGSAPVTFEVDGWSFGCALGIESHFPEAFAEYERLDVDCVLFSSTGDADENATMFAVECAGHAAMHSLWVSLCVPPQRDAAGSAGVVAPGGRWVARCDAEDLVVVDLGQTAPDIEIALTHARPWRRSVRSTA